MLSLIPGRLAFFSTVRPFWWIRTLFLLLTLLSEVCSLSIEFLLCTLSCLPPISARLLLLPPSWTDSIILLRSASSLKTAKMDSAISWDLATTSISQVTSSLLCTLSRMAFSKKWFRPWKCFKIQGCVSAFSSESHDGSSWSAVSTASGGCLLPDQISIWSSTKVKTLAVGLDLGALRLNL